MGFMRRLAAILVVLSCTLSWIGPVLYADPEAQLPSCCRRTGKHACSMAQTAGHLPDGAAVKVSAKKCPYFPVSRAVPVHAKTPLLKSTQPMMALVAVRPAGLVQTEARYRVSFSRSWQKRGPPLGLA